MSQWVTWGLIYGVHCNRELLAAAHHHDIDLNQELVGGHLSYNHVDLHHQSITQSLAAATYHDIDPTQELVGKASAQICERRLLKFHQHARATIAQTAWQQQRINATSMPSTSS